MLIKRFIAFLIDWLSIMLPVNVYMHLNVNMAYPSIEDVLPMLLGFAIAGALLLLHDLVFRDASLGKKIMKLKIVDEKGGKPSASKLILRNITYVIVSLEMIIVLVDKDNKRIGDYLADTKVVSAEVAL